MHSIVMGYRRPKALRAPAAVHLRSAVEERAVLGMSGGVGGHEGALRDHSSRRVAIASELRSMINGYRIDSHTAFPFIRRRRHSPTNSQYAFRAAELWHSISGSVGQGRQASTTIEGS